MCLCSVSFVDNYSTEHLIGPAAAHFVQMTHHHFRRHELVFPPHAFGGCYMPHEQFWGSCWFNPGMNSANGAGTLCGACLFP